MPKKESVLTKTVLQEVHALKQGFKDVHATLQCAMGKLDVLIKNTGHASDWEGFEDVPFTLQSEEDITALEVQLADAKKRVC